MTLRNRLIAVADALQRIQLWLAALALRMGDAEFLNGYLDRLGLGGGQHGPDAAGRRAAIASARARNPSQAACAISSALDVARCALAARQRRTCRSFDYLVGAREQQWRNIQADRLCALEINRQFELGRLLHRQVGRFGT